MTAPKPRLDVDATRERLRALGCGYAAERLDDLLGEAVRVEIAPHAFLEQLLAAELSGREERRVKTSLKVSNLRSARRSRTSTSRSSRRSSARASTRSPPAPGCAMPRRCCCRGRRASASRRYP